MPKAPTRNSPLCSYDHPIDRGKFLILPSNSIFLKIYSPPTKRGKGGNCVLP